MSICWLKSVKQQYNIEMKQFFTVRLSVFLFAFSVITSLVRYSSIFKFFLHKPFNSESSVWCVKTLNNTNLCRFKNVCYDFNIKSFLFFLGDRSNIKGFTHYNELQKIQLSSVHSHNHFYANLSVVDIENYNIDKMIDVKGKGLLFSRFKPNNIMHTFHDDLLPVFFTLEYVCLGEESCMEDYSLIVHDSHSNGPFYNLYKVFSKKDIIRLNEKPSNLNSVLCFDEILMGLVQDSIFYQYGFIKAHGPVKSPYLTQNDIVRFTSFMRKKLKLNEIENDVKGDVVVISRNRTRKILNLEEVKEMIADVYQKTIGQKSVEFLVLDLQVNKSETFIKALSQADVLVGMHGAEMIFSLFMKPNSVVVELFPYAIQPGIVSFIKPVSEIEGSHIHYISWRNMYKNNTVTHPDAHPLFGGINHLNKTVQQRIINTQEVPAVKCCNDPVYLYHMYQDTWVSSDFRGFLTDSLKKCFSSNTKTKSGLIIKKWFFPSPVFNLSCQFQGSSSRLKVKWFPPFNTNPNTNLQYSLYLKDDKDYFRKEFFTQAISVTTELPKQVGTGSKMYLWISVFYQQNSSPDVYFECNL